MKKYSLIISVISFALVMATLSFTRPVEEDIAALRKAYSSGNQSQ